MLRALKREQRLIQTLRLPVSLFATPITGMCSETVDKLMAAPILSCLVGIARAWSNSRRA